MKIAAAMSLVLLLMTGGSTRAQGMKWDFEGEPLTWQPQAKTIAVSRAVGTAATRKSKTSLRVRGRMDGEWHYIISEAVPLQAGRFYRFSGWVRVDKVGPARFVPSLQCMFFGADAESMIGWANTNRYDRARRGHWRRLTGEFQVPVGITQCRMSFEANVNTAVAIDAYLDDVVLEPIQRLSTLEAYRLSPPPALRKARHQHPRLYLNPQRLVQLRAAIKTTHRGLWEEVREQADKAVQSGPPPYIAPENSDDEQLWQRNVGDTMPFLAIAYVLTGEQKYLDSARAWALASCSYPIWGMDGPRQGVDLAAGHQLFGLAIIYDWCYHALDAGTRQIIRETLIKRASHMFVLAARGEAWWFEAYLQNHLWVNMCGLAATGLALFDEVDDASLWIGFALDKFHRTMAALGPDGASHEGAAYWSYGVEVMLKFMHPARDLLGVNFYRHAWWRNTAAYRQYLALPHNAWKKLNNIVDIADSGRRNWYGPDYLLRDLAHQYRDGYAQWLASEIDRANVDNPQSRWLNLLWFDPTVAAKHPRHRPTLRHFRDMEIVSARSAWSGDESLLVFKCGPFIGHKAVREFTYDPGGSHVHPDANHFVLFGAGEWLIRDDSYEFGYSAKFAGQHNTLVIDGHGQLGEGRRTFKGTEAMGATVQPRVLRATSSAALDHITGDATGAYSVESGLKSYRRHLLFLKPDILIVVDDIMLRQPRALELRFHPESTQGERDGVAFMARGKQSVLRIEPLTTEGVTIAAEAVAGPGRGDLKERSMFALRCSTQGARWRNAVALSWSKTGAEPTRIAFQVSGDRWHFTAGQRTVVFDWRTSKASIAGH